MKTLGLVLTALLLTGSAAAQTAAPEPEMHGVSVDKARWQKRFYNPALDEDPLRAANDARQLDRERREAQRTNVILNRQGRERVALPTQPVYGSGGIVPNKPMDVYRYEVKFTNTGTKKIRSLVWAYVLYDEDTQREVGNNGFMSRIDLGSGKSKGVVAMTLTPPVNVVDVSKSAKETAPGQYTERVEIHRVEYEDGTVWERGRQ